jgi:hypothetical protein
VTAEQKPDFSGEYVLNRQASTLSPGADAVRSALLRIEHREPSVRVEAAFHFDDQTFEYTIELSSEGQEALDHPEHPTSSSLRWEGNALLFLFIERDAGSDAEVKMSWRYELEDEGRCLNATEQIRGGGRDQDNVWVFERR